ncbi:MAG: carbohydrate ABC transporter permease [Rhodobacteraceae bacterium]|nr:carbohydrate ABC transporter permease [Paracoccaceae bacterium]
MSPADATHTVAQRDWQAAARRSLWRRRLGMWSLVFFLIVVSLPIMLPYFWMLTISVSARTGGADTIVLWKACAVLVPAVIGVVLTRTMMPPGGQRNLAGLAVIAIAAITGVVLIGPDLHANNYRFLWNPNIVEEIRGSSGAGGDQFPWVWTAFTNSLIFAVANTVVVLTVSTLAGYYISRFAFAGRATFLQSLLVLHAFPAMTLIIPIFLIMHWAGLLDTISGVILVVVTLELPFSIFIMKGFFDAVPWDIEMSAMTDGASRRQAFVQVILPQVKVGMLAVGVFSFLKGWEEYVFVRTLLFEKSNWMMSLYLFWVSDDLMGVDYGIVAAVGVFYVLPSLLLYVTCQKYLVQMTIGGIKG